MKLMDKIVRTRKQHLCGACGEIIPAGSKVAFHESRVPVYDDDSFDDDMGNETQIGIWFNREYRHVMPCLDENGELITVKNEAK